MPQSNSEAALGLNDTALAVYRPGLNLNIAYLRQWGVRWYVVDAKIPLNNAMGLVRVQANGVRNILEDPQALPLVSYDAPVGRTPSRTRCRRIR